MMNKIRAKLYAFLFWQTRSGEVLNKIYDLQIFFRNSFTTNNLKSKESYQAFLTKQYHIIEKGLALPKPRAFFGKPKIRQLIKVANTYIKKFGEDRIIKNIQGTLNTYLKRNEGLITQDLDFYNLILNFVKKNSGELLGGVKKVNKTEIKDAINLDFESFIKSRSSVRFFSKEQVSIKKLQKAIALARYTPSVCNRQSWRVHHFRDRSTMNLLLNIQNGNGGFNQSINQLLIITGDTKKFTQMESNQVFVDGGLFSMSLLLSLHSQEIASCCLNTCLPYLDEVEVKKIANIPQSERLIMMIGIGNYKETYEVAISDRVPLSEILNIS